MFLQNVASPKKMIDNLLAGVFCHVFFCHSSWRNSEAFFCSSMLPRIFSSSGESSGKDTRRHPHGLRPLMATQLGCRWGVPILSILSILSPCWFLSPSSLNPQKTTAGCYSDLVKITGWNLVTWSFHGRMNGDLHVPNKVQHGRQQTQGEVFGGTEFLGAERWPLEFFGYKSVNSVD